MTSDELTTIGEIDKEIARLTEQRAEARRAEKARRAEEQAAKARERGAKLAALVHQINALDAAFMAVASELYGELIQTDGPKHIGFSDNSVWCSNNLGCFADDREQRHWRELLLKKLSRRVTRAEIPNCDVGEL